jgi:hypothetical protein
MTSYIQLLNKIEAFCNAHYQIQRYGGEFREQMPNLSTESEKYPIVFVTPTGGTPLYDTNQISLDIYCVDIIQKNRANLNTIVSDCHLILTDLYGYFSQGSDLSVDVIGQPSQTPLNNLDLDYVAGWMMTIVFEVNGYCVEAIPMGDIPTGGGACEDASYIVEYADGTPIDSGTIPSGGSETIVVPNPIVCEDATYTITDTDLNTLYTGSIPSGGDLQQPIQDSTAVLKDTADNVLSTTQILAEGSEDIIAPDATYTVEYLNGTPIQSGNILSGGFELIQVPNPITCADAVVNVNSVFFDNVASGGTLNIQVRKSTGSNLVGSKQGQHWRIGDSTAVLKTTGGATISTTSIRAEESEDITAPDTEIEVNGVSEGSVVAGATVDIQLSDSLGVVTPISVTQTGNDFAVVLPDAPPAVTRSTATLMKTGQTTSYRTGDDGDLEAGRATDFLTLDAAPLHNDGTATINTTTARFTDTLGGSTYANDIILDWSTWNGSTLLGWYRVINVSNVTWNTAIDNCLAVTVGAFTTGWRLPNRAEIFNICLHEGATLNLPLNYTPFNISLATVFYTSTTQAATTTNCFTLTNNSNVTLGVSTKTGNGRYFPVRTFSLSLLNVLS